MSLSRVALALVGLLCLGGCEQWHLTINSDGLVFISVVGDDGNPRHRFRIRSRDAAGADRVLDVPASGQLTLTPVADGTLELTLLAPESCLVTGSNPRTLTVSSGQEVRLAFDVRCT